ncbi:hypothetical protein U1Q18_010153 [Sarracenia purpurea var. burkii]
MGVVKVDETKEEVSSAHQVFDITAQPVPKKHSKGDHNQVDKGQVTYVNLSINDVSELLIENKSRDGGNRNKFVDGKDMTRISHKVVDEMTQRNYELYLKGDEVSQGQYMGGVGKSPNALVDMLANSGNANAHKVLTDLPRSNTVAIMLNHQSCSGSNTEYSAPKDPNLPGIIDIEENMIDE